MDALFFDTLKIPASSQNREILVRANRKRINLRAYEDGAIGISLDEKTNKEEVASLLAIFSDKEDIDIDRLIEQVEVSYEAPFERKTEWCTHPIFTSYRSEQQLTRYIYRLQNKDLSLTHSMIPLGSCTMKLNSTAELMPVTWPKFTNCHPYAPPEQLDGYAALLAQLATWLADITGLHAVSLQPNSGAQGEYAGLLVIRAYQRDHRQEERNLCLIPSSAHGTNPASAVMAGMKVVSVACDKEGNVSLADLKEKAEKYKEKISTLMITYPSTHGVFEKSILEICNIIHQVGGQVYLDGANMNAQVGLCRPGEYGVDVCHINLHKTFCVPHGGGGPGMGPIAVAKHLADYLPRSPLSSEESKASGAIAATEYASPSFLPVPWMYIATMGSEGLVYATKIAILNANYMSRRLADYYPTLFSNENNYVAHEFIIDCRAFQKTANIEVEQIAKRLMDFGFHAPTMSWPVPGTMMIEPTESESKEELDRFCDAMIAIRGEIAEIESGKLDRKNNMLMNAPHTAKDIASSNWNRNYTRERAAYPLPYLYENKFWPAVGKIDNAYGDRNVMCACPSMDMFGEDA